MKIIPSTLTRKFYKANLEVSEDYTELSDSVTDIEKANIFSSEVIVGKKVMHAPALDIDNIPVFLRESSTPGHYHLIIDKTMTWAQYKRLLKCLASVGIIEKGYCGASIARKYSALRVPWVRKDPLSEKKVLDIDIDV